MASPDQLKRFGLQLQSRRDAILEDWRAKVHADPKLVTGSSLPAAQLNDHLTALLENFERQLCGTPDDGHDTSEQLQVGDAAAHGLHRWQQGFDLAELVRELGRLNESVVAEINASGSRPALSAPLLIAAVHGMWAKLYSVVTSSSADQYFRLQQLEATGHLKDLEQAVATAHALEAERAALWQQAAHDLRGNLSVVSLATAGLAAATDRPDLRGKFLGSLDRNVRSLSSLLEDVTSLARLQGGFEIRSVSPLNVPELLTDVAAAMEGFAEGRHLFIKLAGPDDLAVSGDGTKVRRIVQNLILNAIRYTQHGGITVRWGKEPQQGALRWFVEVEDTGPGLQAGPGSPLAGAINVASELSRDVQKAEALGQISHVSVEASAPVMSSGGPAVSPPGEGIGLSIVKRLCTLLDATIEVDSRQQRGTTFKILFPLSYALP